jgi:hypothetical protein
MQNIIAGLIIGGFGIACVFTLVFPKHTRIYKEAEKSFHKEAYENGHMVKEISKDDEVIYRWKHLEKIGYEETQ